MNWEIMLLAAMYLAVAGGAWDCARLTNSDRNYYPMQRMIWSTFAFFGTLAGVGALMGRPNTTANRLVFAGVLLAAIIYSDLFIRKRNRTARYLPLDLAGQVVYVDAAHLRQQSETITSLVRHGAAPEEWVRGLEEACAAWRRQERWKDHTLPEQIRLRRAEKAAQQQKEQQR